jgi:hypothetical protein
MDKRIKEIYTLILKKNARVVHFLEYKNYYEIHLEWEFEEQSGVHFVGPHYFDDAPLTPWVERKLIALEKIRR